MPNFLTRVRDRLSAFLPEPPAYKPTINSYGQGESGVPMETMQQVMTWLALSLHQAGWGKGSEAASTRHATSEMTE